MLVEEISRNSAFTIWIRKLIKFSLMDYNEILNPKTFLGILTLVTITKKANCEWETREIYNTIGACMSLVELMKSMKPAQAKEM